MSRRVFTIDEALKDPNLLGAALGDPSSWQTWFTVLKAAFGQELSRPERRAFAAVAGSRKPPKQRIRELWAVAGRRCGKSRIAAALAVYFAAFIPHKLAPGERGMVLVLAASQEQARATFDYAKAFLMESPVLRNEVAEMTRSEIRLRNGIIIGIHTNSFRTIRGRTLLMCVFDEIAFWRDETSATPDQEVLTAVMPAFVRGGKNQPGGFLGGAIVAVPQDGAALHQAQGALRCRRRRCPGCPGHVAAVQHHVIRRGDRAAAGGQP